MTLINHQTFCPPRHVRFRNRRGVGFRRMRVSFLRPRTVRFAGEVRPSGSAPIRRVEVRAADELAGVNIHLNVQISRPSISAA